MANSNSLKEVFCENLLNILSPDKNVRELAEQQLAMLETNEGLHLCSRPLLVDLKFRFLFLFFSPESFRLRSSTDGNQP